MFESSAGDVWGGKRAFENTILQAGATSYLLKDSLPAELVQAIERTARGEPAFHPMTATAMVRALSGPAAGRASAVDVLAEREAEVVYLIAEGPPNAAIAQRLGVSEKAVKNHVTSIS